MKLMTTDTNLAHPFWPVKSNETSSIDGTPHSMTHHKSQVSKRGKLLVSYSMDICNPYGVSLDRRVLTKGMLHKHFDKIRSSLHNVVELPNREIQVVLELLRLWAYYGNVYPTAAYVASEAYCSKSTFWRAVMHLKALGLVKTIPRFVFRPHAQISNLYILDKLLILIAKYLAEHIALAWPDWLDPYIHMSWPAWWSDLKAGQLKLPTQSLL